MVVSANGDPSNISNIASGDSIPEWRLVPNDNNIGQRNVFPISGGGTSGLTADFNRLRFDLKNPHVVAARMEVRTVLPSFLEKRGWKIEFQNRGGSAFPLGPGENREIVTKFVPGAVFTQADAAAASDKTIRLYGYAGGILVGGMSYEVDPNLKPPVPEGKPSDKCSAIAETLLNCIEIPHKKVRRVSVHKVNVDIELESDCDC
jgi:hypothetical protein